MIKTALNARITQELYEVLKEKYPNDYVEKVSEFYKEFKTDSFCDKWCRSFNFTDECVTKQEIIIIKNFVNLFLKRKGIK